MQKTLIFLIFALFSALSAQAYDFKSGDLYYNITGNNTAEVTYEDFTNFYTFSSVTIPDTVTHNGITYRVTGIGMYALVNCLNLTSVSFSNSILSIGDNAFAGCKNLSYIGFGDSITSIGNAAFSNCAALTSFIIPNSVTHIGSQTFANCSGLTDMIIPDNVISVGSGLFFNCSGLTSISIGNGLKKIEYHMFFGCTGLTSVTIPDSITTIGIMAFENCSNLQAVYLGEQLDSIYFYAFKGCQNLQAIYCYSPTPPYVVDFDSFDNYNAHIYVPCDSKTDYSYDAIWGLFRYIHCIGEETAIESIPSDFPHQRTRKIFRDNKVIILRDGEEYSILGHKL